MLHRSLLLGCALGAAAVAPAMPSAFAAEPYIGRWAADPARCGGFGGNSPATMTLVATESGLNWFSGYCRIGKMYKLGQAFYIQARCADGGDVPVTLDPRGDRMRVSWNRGKPAEMHRCK
jgi:hypothetical protein